MFVHPHPSVQPAYAHKWTHTASDTTTLAIVIKGVQRVCQIVRHGEKILQSVILCFLFSLSYSVVVYSV